MRVLPESTLFSVHTPYENTHKAKSESFPWEADRAYRRGVVGGIMNVLYIFSILFAIGSADRPPITLKQRI